jgi:metal transporter CNNM
MLEYSRYQTVAVLNVYAQQALPIFLDNLVPSWAALLTSVTLVVLFG